MFKKTLALWVFVITLSSWGCIIRTHHTIDAHITVDIRRVEQQVDNVLDFVTGETDTLPAVAPEPVGPNSRLDTLLQALNPMPSAYAQGSSPAVEEIAGRMRDRNAKVSEHKSNGCFGENNRGYLELRDCDALKDSAAKNEAQKLMADENKDRKALYQELARLNSNQTVGEIEGVTARKWFERGKSGEWYQLPPTGPNFDACRNSANGKKLGDKCVPGTWVQIP
jgi:uncharacterized protein YdbL (DUF1318 family)